MKPIYKIGIALILLNIIALLFLRSCKPEKIAHNEAKIVYQYKYKEKLKEVNQLKETAAKQVTVIKYLKGRTDTITKWVKLNAPDTCQTYIDSLVSGYVGEIMAMDKHIATQDSIISGQDTLLTYSQRITAEVEKEKAGMKKQSRKEKRQAFIKGALVGLGVGTLAGVVIHYQ